MYITAFTVPGKSLAAEFVVIKHFGCESLHVQPFCCLDVVVYMLNCVFWRHIPLEIEFKSWLRQQYTAVSPISGSPTCDTEKKRGEKIERGEFITPPRPTARRSNQKSVAYMFDTKRHGKIINDKVMRWRIELSMYDFDIIYLAGEENIPADALSRVKSMSLDTRQIV